MKYAARIDMGQGGKTTIEAENPDESLGFALEWAKKGDWKYSEDPSANIVNVEVVLEGESFSDFSPSYRSTSFSISPFRGD